MDYKNNFNLVRLFAACEVMSSHSLTWLNLPHNPGVAQFIRSFDGVAVFFVVSGFLISKSWLTPGTNLVVFADHRIRRIYPALWVNLIGISVLLVLSGCLLFTPLRSLFWVMVTGITGSDALGTRLGGIIFQPGFYEVFPSGVLWTIPVELGFYILTPLVLWKHTSREKMLIAIGCCATASIIIYLSNVIDAGSPYSTPKYFWLFLLGAAVNLYWDKLKKYLEDKGAYWLAAFSMFAIAMNAGKINIYYAAPSIISILSTALLGLTAISVANSFFAISPTLKGKDFSYGIYLWHMPVIWTVRGFGLTGSWLIATSAYLIAAILAALSWYIVERPILAQKMSKAREPFNSSFLGAKTS